MVALGPRVGGAYVGVNLKFNNRSVDLVGGQIHRQLARIGERNRAVYQGIGRDTVTAWRAALGAIVTSAPLLGSAVSALSGAVTMLAGSLYSTVQSSLAFLPLLSSLGIAAGTAKIGFEGFGDAIKAADPKELAEALAKLSPSAQKSALAVRSLKDAWSTLQQSVQENLFAGLSGEISKLGTTVIPVLESGLSRMATSLNGLFDSLLKYVNSESGLAQINGVLQGSVGIFDRLRGAAVPFLDGFLRLLNALTPAGERLADRITDIAERFQSWTQAEGFGNRINDMMLRAEKTAGLLWTVLRNLGSAIANVFNAGNAETNNFLQMLVDVTQKFRDWTASAEGKNSIVTWLQGANDVMAAFGRATKAVFEVIKELADPRVMVSFLETVQGAFEYIGKLPLETLVDGFVRITEAIRPISEVLLAVIIAGVSFNILIGTVAGQLGGLVSGFFRVSDAGSKLKTSFSSFGYVGKHVGTTTSKFSGLLNMVGRLAKFAGPVGLIVWIGTLIAGSDELKEKLGNVWDSFQSVFSALGGAFSEISEALSPVVSGLQPVFDIMDKIARIAIGVVLDQISQAFRTLASVISGIGSIVAGFINVLVGLFTLDFGKVGDGLKQMFSGIGTILGALWNQIMSMLNPGKLLELGVAAFTGLWNGITTVVPIILSGIGTLLTNILNFFIGLPGQLWSLATSAFSSIGTGAAEAGPGIFAAVLNLITGILEFFITLPLRILAFALNAFAAVLEAIAKHGPTILVRVGLLIAGIFDWFQKLPGRLLALATTALISVFNAIVKYVPKIVSSAGNIITGVIDWFVKLPGRLNDLAESAIKRVAGAIAAGVGSVGGKARDVGNSVVDAIKGLPQRLFKIGGEMISELASGILGKLKSVKDAASRVVNAVKSFFPGSPVKEGPLKAWNYGGGASGGGRNLIDAIAKGLQDVSPIKRAMNDVASAVAGSIPARGTGTVSPNARTTQPTPSGPTYRDVNVTLNMDDLKELKTLEQFLEMLQVRAVMSGGTV